MDQPRMSHVTVTAGRYSILQATGPAWQVAQTHDESATSALGRAFPYQHRYATLVVTMTREVSIRGFAQEFRYFTCALP